MGLIKSMVSAVGGTLHDQWQELIKCEDMGNDILMRKVSTSSGQISKGSRIQVSPGQVAVIFDSGRILDATAEEGIYEFDQSSSPSFFGGQFGAVFGEMWQRFKYNGAVNKEQAIYYFNVKEILDNKFGTATPIAYQDWSHPIPNQMTGTYSPLRVEVRCYGKYTFRIADPVTFMRIHAGTADVVRKDEITEQMRAEVIGAFQNVLNELGNSNHKVPVLELPSQTDEIKATMDEKVFDEAIRNRGLQLVGFIVESVSLDEESSKKIDNYEMASNSMMQQGTLVGAYANAVQSAASNANGAAQGFMGVGMMNMASGGMMGGVAQAPFQTQQATPENPIDPFARPVVEQAAPMEQPVESEVQPVEPVVEPTTTEVPVSEETVEAAPAEVTAKFCSNCGTPVNGKFCSNCGTAVQQ